MHPGIALQGASLQPNFDLATLKACIETSLKYPRSVGCSNAKLMVSKVD
jgi:hypothetical protein